MATLTTGKLSEQFEDFLKTLTDKKGEYLYRSRISQLTASGGKSLLVDYEDLIRYNDELAKKLLEEPDKTLESFRTAAFETLRSENPRYADQVGRVLAVRIRGIPDRVALRKVDTSQIDRMIAVSGMVVRASELRPLMTEAAFVCDKGDLTYQTQDDMLLKKPTMCETCDSRNLELDKKHSKFVDYQILRVQELPEELPPGQLPQFFDVNGEGDVVNTARPGDRVILTGIVRAVPDYSPGQGRMRLFKSQIDCNHIEVIGKEPEQIQITKEDEAIIRSIPTSPDAYQKLASSIAPAILGHEPEREAILLLLAGGAATLLPDGTKLRGDVNVLFVGDPGTAKSEMLKFAAQVAPRGLFASGRGTTAAGLSAAVIRERNVLMLEAGVVVLADQGVAAIDEFDKMRPEDRGALHEQMEQQQVTIAKGGIYATLNARTAILAATNPLLGKYNPFQNLTENINLPIPLLSVGPDEQILVRRNDVIVSTQIGKFVDSFYSGTEAGYPMYVENSRLEVASMDENFKTTWRPLRYVFRHRAESETYRISFKGRDLVLSGGHCVYTFEKGRLTIKPTSRLRSGDYIAISRRLPAGGHYSRTFKVLDYLSPEGLYLHNVADNALHRIAGIPAHHRRRGMLSALRHHELKNDELEAVTISVKGSGFYVPSFVPLSADLLRLLGYFVSEGSLVFLPYEGVYAVDFSLNRNKDGQLVSDIVSISKKLFRVKPTVRKAKNEVKVDIRSRVAAEFLGKCFGLASGATKKRVPDIVFNVTPELKWEFLKAYYAGDGGTTTSKELASQLLQLFAQLGHVSSLFHVPPSDTTIEGRRVNSTGWYRVPLPQEGPQSNDTHCFPPLTEVLPILRPILGKFAPHKTVRRVLTPRYWNELRNAVWVRNKMEKLTEARHRPITAVGLAERFGIKGGGGCQGFVRNMTDEGLLLRERIANVAGRHYLYSLTEKGKTLLETVDYLDKLVVGDLAFVKIREIEKVEEKELPRFVYDVSVPGSENFVADTAICHNTRFDLIFVIKDTPSPAEDERLASHILAVHRKRGYNAPPPIEFSLLKKYIAYAKKITPILTKEAEDRIKDFYLDLRRRTGPDQIGATPRTLESLIRLATARARIMLREQVLEEDALNAISLMNKMVEDVLTDQETKTRVDFGVLLGRPAGERGKLGIAIEILKRLEGTERRPVERKVFKDELMKSTKFANDEDAEKIIKTMFKEGLIYESKPGFFRRVGS